MSVEIRRTTFDEVRLSGLPEECAEESSIKELPPPVIGWDQYKAMEEAGYIYPLGAYLGSSLIGMVFILSPPIPHYEGIKLAVTESYFVAKAYRKSGAGLRLLKAAEEYAKESGCIGILVSSPFDGDLSQVLPRVGYRETNVVFYKNV